jgi:hypothetical protein
MKTRWLVLIIVAIWVLAVLDVKVFRQLTGAGSWIDLFLAMVLTIAAIIFKNATKKVAR